MQITVVRHGPTLLNEGGRLRGWINVGLSDTGIAEAEAIQHVPTRMFSSDLLRAQQTAQIICRGVHYQLTPALRPWNVGLFAGQPGHIVHPKLVAYQRSGLRVPFGEAWPAFVDRYTAFLRSLTEPCTLVTHFRNCKLLQAWQATGFTTIDMDVLTRDDVNTSAVLEFDLPW